MEVLIAWVFMTVIYIICVIYTGMRGLNTISKLKKEHEDQLAKERIEWEGERELLEEQIDDFVRNNTYWQDEYTKEKKSNSSLKGWNVKYRKTIEKLEAKKEDLGEDLIKAFKKIDESKPMCEKLLTMVKKKDMEEAKAIVKEYYKM